MSTEANEKSGGALVQVPAPPIAIQQFTAEQRELIKRTVAFEATDDELAMFLHVAARAGLDPLQKQIHFTKRRRKRRDGGYEAVVTIIAGVDGLQARAARMPDFEGITYAVVCAKDDFTFDHVAGQVVRHVTNPFGQRGPVLGAWAIVRRRGLLPFVALIRIEEYLDHDSYLWRDKPHVMIEKVARSTALRRAYPEAFSSIYDAAEFRDERGQAPKADQHKALEEAARALPVNASLEAAATPPQAAQAAPVLLPPPVPPAEADVASSVPGAASGALASSTAAPTVPPGEPPAQEEPTEAELLKAAIEEARDDAALQRLVPRLLRLTEAERAWLRPVYSKANQRTKAALLAAQAPVGAAREPGAEG